MGYYSSFHLDVYTDEKLTMNVSKETEKEIMTRLCGKGKYFEGSQFESFDELRNDIWKWYDCEDELKKMSRAFHDYWFQVEVHGEDRDDNWMGVFHNGVERLFEGRIVYEEVK